MSDSYYPEHACLTIGEINRRLLLTAPPVLSPSEANRHTGRYCLRLWPDQVEFLWAKALESTK